LSSLRQFAEAVMQVVPDHRLTIAPTTDPSAITRNVTGLLSIDRARKELGYEPDFPAVAGVPDYVAMLRYQRATSSPSIASAHGVP
jgi:nucleoside-diphosphate-sugar epimerase